MIKGCYDIKIYMIKRCKCGLYRDLVNRPILEQIGNPVGLLQISQLYSQKLVDKQFVEFCRPGLDSISRENKLAKL